MRITKWGEYAILCSLRLAQHYRSVGPQACLSAAELSELQKIPLQYTHQILFRLKSGGIIESERGPRGGYRLHNDPASVSLKDIFLAAEGETLELLCENGPVYEEACSKAGRCGLRSVWFELREAVNDVLMKYSLADLLKNHDFSLGEDGSAELVQLGERREE